MTGDMKALAYPAILIQQNLKRDLVLCKKPLHSFLLFLDAYKQHFERLSLVTFFETEEGR